MILLQIFAFSAIAGAGMYAGVTAAVSLHEMASTWRRGSRLR